MENFIDFEKLGELISTRNYRELRVKLAEMNEVNIALFIEELPVEKATVAFRTLPKGLAADVFANLSSDTQEYIIGSINDQELAVIVEDLFVDDAVDMLEELPASVVKRVLKNATPDTRALINQFLQYPENSAGSIMTAEFTDLRRNMTVEDAIKHIRRTGEDRETVYTCYVIDDRRILDGVVTVKDLLLSEDDCSIENIMNTNFVSVTTLEDREEVAKLFAKYDLLSIPVVDHEGRLVGIVTVDDAVDVMEQEATEDFEKMAAMIPSEKPYLKTGVFVLAKNRIMWLLVLMISGMITGSILGKYEAAFAAMPMLVTFIPMLTDTGGNAGSQSSTLVIRGMAVSEISTKDLVAVMWKELRVSMLVGIALSAVNFVRLVITYPGNELIALTVALSLFATVVIAKTIGGALPIIAKLFKADPAIMAAPLITTIVDAFSLIIYFSVAEKLLHL
ncbi:magnesium transporter [Hydrogenoanaerobacterium saccharovorans]|uniref:Magnesium transporter MgtE n=1 Tax=Hydrogenoanaerobacterium saccharovorans TaxID=474960 RepID=A0A1H7ZV01_9FIRM|nr:magnesium transporter [Hydrogenoanaerobacterium saccharovorans]RPF48360.1 magnesium transporter [Hydrogenoanaerobacterium saccharovorans]SEM62260.1 magnesium transporter [Hydrogenoanaerobacterium saccharovorans]